MADNTKKTSPSSRQKLLDSARGWYPDRKFRDLDAPVVEGEEGFSDLDDAIAEKVESLQSEQAAANEKNGKLRDLLLNDPYSAECMQVWLETGDPRAALVKTFGDDLGISDENKEKFKNELADWRSRRDASDEADKVAKQNYLASLDQLKSWGESKGISMEQQRDIMVRLLQIAITGFCEGKYSTEDFEMVYNSMNHASDVENARKAGEVAGRNERIEAQRRDAASGGVLPTAVGLGGGKVPEKKPVNKPKSAFAGIR